MRLLFTILLILEFTMGIAQTVQVPDTNLRNKLIADYPQVMQGNELIISEAAALTGALDLRFANISDATGIQYFTSIATLDLSENILTTIPDISAISGLVNFYASNNQLTFLPEMSNLPNLLDFQVMNNQLIELPKLTASTHLKRLYCSNNHITKLPSLSQFPELDHLVIGNNPITDTLDFSQCPYLTQLHVHKLNLDTIIGLEKLENLTTLFAWGNKIRSFSGLDSNTTLTICVVFDNLISEVPYLNNKPDLNRLEVYNCRLTFEDIHPIISRNAPATFGYSPQKEIQMTDKSVREESRMDLMYPIKNPHRDNIYVWIKDGTIVDSSTNSSYTINPIKNTHSGNYILKIYNPEVPGLILNSNTITLNVLPCIEFNISFLEIIDKKCGAGYTIDLSNVEVLGGTPPYTYEVSNAVYRKRFTDEYIEHIPAGKFEIKITDSKKCTATDPITLNRIEKCDPVITPNGDGIADSYYIEKTGTVHIYDLKRNLINTLEAPINWDGTNKNGALVDAGYYIMLTENNSPIYITVIR